MKLNFKTRILGACNVFLLVFGTLILREYMANHTYYYDMLNNSSNLYIILATLICAAVPMTYMLYWKTATIKGLGWTTWIGLMLYGILYASIKENILGTGAIMRAVNSLIIFGLSVFTLTGILSIGLMFYKKIYSASTERSRRSVILAFGIGFGVFVVFNYILILVQAYYPIVTRLQLIGLGFIIWKNKEGLKELGTFFNNNIKLLFYTKSYNYINRIIAILCLISFAYYIIGFKLAYIPYPTAWDANHAYMLIPNAISSSHGLVWNTVQETGYMPVYLSFVSFFFSLIKGLGSKFRISPDTFGVEMNYVMAILTFITTLGIIDKTINLVTSKDSKHKSLIFSLGRFTKILWLTSGMGAFLVFVDNKSDFGVMYLACLGLFSGLGYIDYLIKKYNQNKDDDISKSEGLTDLYLSGLFFGLAVASKLTALFDAMNFVLLVIGFLLGGIVLIGISLIIMGLFVNLGFNGVTNFIAKPFANIIGFGGGSLLTIFGLGKGQYKSSYAYWPKLVGIAKQLLLRSLIFIGTLTILKLPIGLYRLYHGQTDAIKLPKEIIFGYEKEEKSEQKFILLASTNTLQVLANTGIQKDEPTVNQEPVVTDKNTQKQLTFQQCSLAGVGVADAKDLYKNLISSVSDSYTEDVGRYVGFGQKTFDNPWWGFLFPNGTCISINASAKVLCENQSLITALDKNNTTLLLAKLKPGSEGYNIVNAISTGFDSPDKLSTHVADSQKLLNDYRQDKTIKKDGSKVSIPYKTLVPLNVTFNRSLQNLSSYYTDIGIIRLILQFFIVVGLIYGLRTQNRLLRSINLVALIGRLFWITIGGGIVWYAIGLITWTIMGFVLFVHDLYVPSEESDEHSINHTLFVVFIGLFMIFGIIQLALNFVRISSQGGGGAFLQYRYSNGQQMIVDENLQQKVSVKFPYTRHDIVNLQFPHYNKVINAINNQTGDETNIIAGTYAQYWVKDQTRVYGDGLLTQLYKWLSDGNICKSYLRLKDKNFKYIVVDPNIASIVMGGGNNSLMERFLAKLDPNGKIVQDGTLSMLSKLVNGGYMSVYSTNNLGAKYGFGLPSAYLKSKFGITNDDDLVMLRARLATVRFWGNQEQMIQALAQIFTERIANGEAVTDIADVYGKVIDESKLAAMITKAANEGGFASIATEVKDLTQDERFVLLNYLNALTSYNRQPAQFGSIATSIVTQSLGGGSQLIVFEVK